MKPTTASTRALETEFARNFDTDDKDLCAHSLHLQSFNF